MKLSIYLRTACDSRRDLGLGSGRTFTLREGAGQDRAPFVSDYVGLQYFRPARLTQLTVFCCFSSAVMICGFCGTGVCGGFGIAPTNCSNWSVFQAAPSNVSE